MSDDLILSLRGPFRARLGPAPVEGLSRRAQGLLCFLSAQPGMRAERGTLADLLWPDRAEEQARASLRQELSVLRRTLPGDIVSADRHCVWLDPGRVTIDRQGDAEPLQGFDLPSEPFEDWLRHLRAAALSDPAPAAPDARPGLAVMPFDEVGAPEGDMFAVGVVEEITGALSRVHDFDVIARQSAFALGATPLPVQQAASRLGAAYLVEGTVRRHGERVRISVQLVRGGDGHVLWNERFDDRIDDLFDMQDRIAQQVAGRLAPNLRAAEIGRASARPPHDRSAYDLMLTALPAMWAHDRNENARALALLAEARRRDPDYARAAALRAWCHAQNCVYLWSTDPDSDKAEARALIRGASPGDDAPALVALAAASALASSDFGQADAFVDRALAIDPNNAWGWMRKGWNAVYRSRPAEAQQAFARAERLSPLDPFHFNMLLGRSAAARQLRQLDESIALIEAALREGPRLTWAYRMLYGTHLLAGNHAEAMRARDAWLAAYPGITPAYLRSTLPSWDHDQEYVKALFSGLSDDPR